MSSSRLPPIARVLAAAGAALYLTAGPAAAEAPARNVAGTAPVTAVQAPAVVATVSVPAGNVVVKAAKPAATLSLNDPKCTSFVLTGTAPNQTLTCQ